MTWLAGHGHTSGVVAASNSIAGSTSYEWFGYAPPTLFDDGTAVFVDPGFDLGHGAVAPRRVGASRSGTVGHGEDDVSGTTTSSGAMMTFDYDPRTGTLVVGDPGMNLVTLRHLENAAGVRHSHHATRRH